MTLAFALLWFGLSVFALLFVYGFALTLSRITGYEPPLMGWEEDEDCELHETEVRR